MKNILSCVLVLLSLSFPNLSYSETKNELALKLIEDYRIGENLYIISFETALRTKLMKALAASISQERAIDLIKSELDVIVPRYQDQWNNNLALIYSNAFTKVELESLVDQGPKSKFSEKMQSSGKQNEIAIEMKFKSSGIVQKILEEAIVKVYLKFQ